VCHIFTERSILAILLILKAKLLQNSVGSVAREILDLALLLPLARVTHPFIRAHAAFASHFALHFPCFSLSVLNDIRWFGAVATAPDPN
jgi:hypothetical protein